jgi:hypothetical protein
MVALDVGREQSDAEVLGERQDSVLGGSDPLAAHFDHNTTLKPVVQDAPADTVAGLQYGNRKPGSQQVARGDQPGPHHGDVNLATAKANTLHCQPFLLSAGVCSSDARVAHRAHHTVSLPVPRSSGIQLPRRDLVPLDHYNGDDPGVRRNLREIAALLTLPYLLWAGFAAVLDHPL